MWFLLGFLALVLVEIFLLLQLGGAIGIWLTLAWIILTGALGVILLKGVAMLGSASLSTRMEVFQEPNSPLAHRALVLIAGLFLILPGPLTDTLGILLLFAPIRSVLIRLIGRRFSALAGAHSIVVDGEWRDVSAQKGAGADDQHSKLP